MTKTGTIEALNVSPKGFHEGFLLNTAKGVIQINLPKNQIDSAVDRLKPGDAVTAKWNRTRRAATPSILSSS